MDFRDSRIRSLARRGAAVYAGLILTALTVVQGQQPAYDQYGQPYEQGYDATYDPAQPQQHNNGERPDGSQQ